MKPPILTAYRKYDTKNNAAIDGVNFPGMKAEFFQRKLNDYIESIGVFSYSSQPFLMAWGDKDAAHCAHHIVRYADGHWSEVIQGCPSFEPLEEAGVCIGLVITVGNEKIVVNQNY